MRTDIQTDRTKLIVALRNFVDAPENRIDSDSRLYLGTVLTVFFCVTSPCAYCEVRNEVFAEFDEFPAFIGPSHV
jgi:hypothetical protein